MPLQEFPMASHRRTFPIQRVSSRAVLAVEALAATAGRAGELQLLHRAVFSARTEALRVMIRDGFQPVDEGDVHVVIEVRQRAVSDEVDGRFCDVGEIREDMHHITIHTHDATALLWR